MKYTLTALIFIFSFSSFGQNLDKSIRMDNLLQDFGIRTWGKREYRDATIVCRVPRKTQSLTCKIMSGPMDSTYAVFEQFEGKEAQKVSNLLKEFDQLPYGKRQRQDLDIQCQNIRGSSEKICKIQDIGPIGF